MTQLKGPSRRYPACGLSGDRTDAVKVLVVMEHCYAGKFRGGCNE